MKELGPASEHEMILAFLQAEVDSNRFGAITAQALQQVGATRTLIDQPDVKNATENGQRLDVLSRTRGYPGQLLFQGFPDDVAWRRVQLEPEDFKLLRYCNSIGAPTFNGLSGGTRRVLDAAANFPGVPPIHEEPHIRAVSKSLRAGKTYPPLIAVEDGAGGLLILEGYTRATAHALVGTRSPVEFIIGTSPRIASWAFY